MAKEKIMKRVLFIETGVSSGGSFESLFLILKHLNRSKYQPSVLFLNETRYLQRCRDLGMPVYLVNDSIYTVKRNSAIKKSIYKFSNLCTKALPSYQHYLESIIHRSTIERVVDIIRQENIDLVYLNDHIARDYFGMIAAMKCGVPCISHLRSVALETYSRYKVHRANAHVSAFIANSEATRRYWSEWGIDPSKMSVIYNIAPEMETSTNTANMAALSQPHAKVVGCLSRLVSWKGVGVLIDAFGRLLRTGVGSHLLIIGDGPLRQTLEQKVHSLDIDDRVTFTGYVEHPLDMMAQMDVLVLPSENEPFGRVLIEAMQVGLPVIGTRSGAIPEIIRDGENGLLVDYGDVEELAEAMRVILEDNELAQAMVRSAKEEVHRRFSPPVIMKQLESLLDSMLENGHV
ncbi:MAG: glycosyltransferase family 4 protein [Syntrophaceae bacterium]|nr:glycosyltransferase family 4 protein [Syntrophaceae bacterium]